MPRKGTFKRREKSLLSEESTKILWRGVGTRKDLALAFKMGGAFGQSWNCPFISKVRQLSRGDGGKGKNQEEKKKEGT